MKVWTQQFLFAICFACAAGCRTPSALPAMSAAKAQTVSLREYVKRLPPESITVGLDVDDTALFSTPAFLYAKGRLLPELPIMVGPAEADARVAAAWAAALPSARDVLFNKVVSAARPDALSPSERTQWRRFWSDVNTRGGSYSPPKAIARALVTAHLRRGDKIVFITARPRTPDEALTAKLRQDFGSDRLQVYFTELQSKAEFIRANRLFVYYGDADRDIDDANAAGAHGVRIIRSRYSSNDSETKPGARQEWFVIADSDL